MGGIYGFRGFCALGSGICGFRSICALGSRDLRIPRLMPYIPNLPSPQTPTPYIPNLPFANLINDLPTVPAVLAFVYALPAVAVLVDLSMAARRHDHSNAAKPEQEGYRLNPFSLPKPDCGIRPIPKIEHKAQKIISV